MQNTFVTIKIVNIYIVYCFLNGHDDIKMVSSKRL